MRSVLKKPKRLNPISCLELDIWNSKFWCEALQIPILTILDNENGKIKYKNVELKSSLGAFESVIIYITGPWLTKLILLETKGTVESKVYENMPY